MLLENLLVVFESAAPGSMGLVAEGVRAMRSEAGLIMESEGLGDVERRAAAMRAAEIIEDLRTDPRFGLH